MFPNKWAATCPKCASELGPASLGPCKYCDVGVVRAFRGTGGLEFVCSNKVCKYRFSSVLDCPKCGARVPNIRRIGINPDYLAVIGALLVLAIITWLIRL